CDDVLRARGPLGRRAPPGAQLRSKAFCRGTGRKPVHLVTGRKRAGWHVAYQLAAAANVFGMKPAQILMQAEAAIEQLKRRGVTVLVGKAAAKDDQSFAYLGAAALGALVAAILAKGK